MGRQTIDNSKNLDKRANKGPTIGVRHLQVFLLFFNIVVIYIARLNIGIAVVAMTNSNTTNPNFQEFPWTAQQKSLILSSFYWGYVFTQFPGGYMCRKLGAKVTMFAATFGSATLSMLTPVCVVWGDWQVFCAIRVGQGLFQGLIFPCIHDHLAKWSPVQERNRLGAFSHTGIECGNVLAMFLSGMIARSRLGWPGISYVSGGICLIWCVLWIVLASNSPNESGFITKPEKTYIELSLKGNNNLNKGKIPIPWLAIFSSIPFYALLVARCAEAWGVSTMQAEIPSYMHGILLMDIKRNAFFSSLPFFAMWVFSYIYLLISDLLLKTKKVSLTLIRKSFNTVAFWLPAVALIAIGFLDKKQKPLAITLMTLGVGFNSGSTIGSSLNTIDLSPNHAGILMGILNTIASLVPIVTPLVAGIIVTDKHNRQQWQIVFLIAAVILFLGNLIYIVCGSADTQVWDAPNFLEQKDLEKQELQKAMAREKARQNTRPRT